MPYNATSDKLQALPAASGLIHPYLSSGFALAGPPATFIRSLARQPSMLTSSSANPEDRPRSPFGAWVMAIVEEVPEESLRSLEKVTRYPVMVSVPIRDRVETVSIKAQDGGSRKRE
jgi:hypothetical protein